jgi:[CysO sulfur-carrier protein]-S-L-cysteine hydrolase
VTLPRAVADEMVAHARSELPNEACGILGGVDGTISSFHATRNSDASPYRYNVESADAVRVMYELDEAGEDIVAIYHSHTKSAAYPSRTDVQLGDPSYVYIIVSLARPEADVKAYRLSREAETIEPLELVIA